MPLFERARIEIYLPDLPSPAYRELLERLAQELTYTFGGCILASGLIGSYQSHLGLPIQDRINLLYSDAPFTFEEGFTRLSSYTDILRDRINTALDEEAILIVALRVYHSA